MGILHGDTIDATVQLESSDIHASEIERGAEFSGLLAGSKQYGLIKAGVALEGNKAGEKNVYRLGGEGGIKFLAMRHTSSALRSRRRPRRRAPRCAGSASSLGCTSIGA